MSNTNTTTTMTTSRPSLEEAQEAVGGFVEVIPVERGQLLVNEEGLLMSLPLNPTASQIAGRPIVGNALLLKGDAQWS
tara:strand:- start:85 stop:318 length:234 start_codon:yes stop_codon:yes gene_type:complete